MSPEETTAFPVEALAQRLGLHRTETLARLVQKALLQDETIRQRSMKGAAGQKAAADDRRRVWEKTAQQLTAGRRQPFTSYRQLAEAVVRQARLLESTETVRKHLAGIRILDE